MPPTQQPLLSSSCFTRRSRGMALITTLTMLVVVMLLSVTGARIALDGKRNARSMRDMDVAFQAAEAALRDAELDIEESPGPASRSRIFSHQSSEGFLVGCNMGTAGAKPYLGLCLSRNDSTPAWNEVDWDTTVNPRTVKFGDFTGRSFPTGAGSMPARVPRYLIELMTDNGNGTSATGQLYVYRITALGFGPNDATRAMVQSVYRKSAR